MVCLKLIHTFKSCKDLLIFIMNICLVSLLHIILDLINVYSLKSSTI